jgi:TPR repeat protein
LDLLSFKALLADKIIFNIEELNDAVRLIGDLMMADGNDDDQKKFGFEQYKIAAENGDVQAMFEIANCFNSGNGVKQNIPYATVWLQRAASNDHEEAIAALDCYFKNPNTRKIFTPFCRDDFFIDSYERHYFCSVSIFGSTLCEMGFNHFENNHITYEFHGLSDGMYLVGYEIGHYPPDDDGYGEEWSYRYGYYDKNFYPVIPFQYSKAGLFQNGTAKVTDSTGSYVINKKGERIDYTPQDMCNKTLC